MSSNNSGGGGGFQEFDPMKQFRRTAEQVSTTIGDVATGVGKFTPTGILTSLLPDDVKAGGAFGSLAPIDPLGGTLVGLGGMFKTLGDVQEGTNFLLDGGPQRINEATVNTIQKPGKDKAAADTAERNRVAAERFASLNRQDRLFDRRRRGGRQGTILTSLLPQSGITGTGRGLLQPQGK